jgi:hypothetical protein
MVLSVILIFVSAFAVKTRAACVAPPAQFCFPSANLTELSGCIAMCDKEGECEGKSSQEEKLECACTQELLDAYFK